MPTSKQGTACLLCPARVSDYLFRSSPSLKSKKWEKPVCTVAKREKRQIARHVLALTALQATKLGIVTTERFGLRGLGGRRLFFEILGLGWLIEGLLNGLN